MSGWSRNGRQGGKYPGCNALQLLIRDSVPPILGVESASGIQGLERGVIIKKAISNPTGAFHIKTL